MRAGQDRFVRSDRVASSQRRSGNNSSPSAVADPDQRTTTDTRNRDPSARLAAQQVHSAVSDHGSQPQSP